MDQFIVTLFSLLSIACELHQASVVPQIGDLAITNISTPATVDFAEGHQWLLGITWICRLDAEQRTSVDMEKFLTDRERLDRTPNECCAILYVEQCVDLKRDNYAQCHAPEVQAYFAKIHDFYAIQGGCEPYFQNGTLNHVCSSAVGSSRLVNQLVFIIFSVFFTFYLNAFSFSKL